MIYDKLYTSPILQDADENLGDEETEETTESEDDQDEDEETE